MVSTHCLRCSVAYVLVVCYVFAVTCTALVVTAPTLDGKTITTTRENARTKTKVEHMDLKLRIRSTTESDIREIANMLTQALLEEETSKPQPSKQYFQSPINFGFMKVRAGVAPLVESRMNAINVGKKVLNDHMARGHLQDLPLADQLRLLWSNDSFRNSIEKAASLSNEPHIWKEHNFVCAPQSFDWLFHKMITAENALTGEIIGFCEIAMLSQPSDGDSSYSNNAGAGSSFFNEECVLEGNQPGIPTIVNLVTSTKYRRRGVGSAVMKSAMNYLEKSSSKWNQMGLYVEEDNHAAIRVYERLGFQKQERVESKQQWYMVRKMPSRLIEEPTIHEVESYEESYDMYLI